MLKLRNTFRRACQSLTLADQPVRYILFRITIIVTNSPFTLAASSATNSTSEPRTTSSPVSLNPLANSVRACGCRFDVSLIYATFGITIVVSDIVLTRSRVDRQDSSSIPVTISIPVSRDTLSDSEFARRRPPWSGCRRLRGCGTSTLSDLCAVDVLGVTIGVAESHFVVGDSAAYPPWVEVSALLPVRDRRESVSTQRQCTGAASTSSNHIAGHLRLRISVGVPEREERTSVGGDRRRVITAATLPVSLDVTVHTAHGSHATRTSSDTAAWDFSLHVSVDVCDGEASGDRPTGDASVVPISEALPIALQVLQTSPTRRKFEVMAFTS